MNIQLNGTTRDVDEAATVADVVTSLLADQASGETTGTAVAVGGEVVRRGEWATTRLSAGDRVEVLRAVQGGCGHGG